jgi:hypothetical protein
MHTGNQTPPRRPDPALRVFVVMLALMVLLCGGAWLYALERGGGRASRVHAQLRAARLRPPAQVAAAVRAMKLITVQLDTMVTVERGEESWRGDVKAQVKVPVRLHYGTDLTALDVSRVTHSLTLAGVAEGPGGVYVVKLPRPERVATEVFREQENADVKTGWLRLRSQAGEYFLGLARRDASDEARDLTLLPADEAYVRTVTREQVSALVMAVVGEEASVRVLFDEETLADAAPTKPSAE